jgi:predicted nucleic acid-binding protein
VRRVYLDVCCLNRPFDDQRQDRIRLEAEAVERILDRLHMRRWEWVGSEVIQLEIGKTPVAERRHRLTLLASSAHRTILVGPAEEARASDLETLGFKDFDALHIACAESGRAEVFLTTDDRLQRLAKRHAGRLAVLLENPVSWLQRESE